MSATLGKNIAIIDGVTQITQNPMWSNSLMLKAIAPEQIPPHTINKIKVGIKAVNVWFQLYWCEAMAMRGLMIAGGIINIYRDEDEVFEVEIPVMNLTNENVNISVGDEIAEMYCSDVDEMLELSQADWDNYDGYGTIETLTITVTDWTDPIEGASVSIDGGTAKTTDSSGEAEFSNVTATTHTVKATMDGYDTYEEEVEIDGATLTVAMSETPAPDAEQ